MRLYLKIEVIKSYLQDIACSARHLVSKNEYKMMINWRQIHNFFRDKKNSKSIFLMKFFTLMVPFAFANSIYCKSSFKTQKS